MLGALARVLHRSLRGPKPSVARCAEPQLASARSSVSIGTAIASASAAARRSSRIGSPIPNTRLAATVVASSAPIGAARAGQVQRVGRQLVQPQTPERDEQFIAPGPAQAGQRQALEQPLEAPLRASSRGRPRRPPPAPPAGRPRAQSTAGRRAACSSPRAGSCEVRGPSTIADRSGALVGGRRGRAQRLANPGERVVLRPRPARGTRSGSTPSSHARDRAPASARTSP